MNPPAIFGMSQLVQIYNSFSETSSPAIPTSLSTAIPNISQAVSTPLLNNGSAIPVGKVEVAGQKCPQTGSNKQEDPRFSSSALHPPQLNIVNLFRICQFLKPIGLHVKPIGLQGLEYADSTCQEAVRDYYWKSRCQEFFPGVKLDEALPQDLSYKEVALFLLNNFFGESFWRHHIGEVNPAPELSIVDLFNKCNQPDPCDPTKKICRNYVLMYLPSHVETTLPGFCLDKKDDPENSEAPRVIPTDGSLEAQSENPILKVAVTINNIIELFKHPKAGNPSNCRNIWNQIVLEHGNKRIPAGWIYMRRDLIGGGLSRAQQEALPGEKGVKFSELLPRILFNFMEHSRSRKVGVYPDGEDPKTYARTSTLTRDYIGTNWYSACGAGGPFGLSVTYPHVGNEYVIGMAVVLPAEV